MIPRSELQKITVQIIGTLFIVLFVYTATSKLLTINAFYEQLTRFPVLKSFPIVVAWGIPIVELVIALMFLFPKMVLRAFYSSLTLMTLFTVYIVWVLKFSNSTPCSCGGVISRLGWTDHIIFNCGFILLAFLGIVLLEKGNRTIIDKNTT